MNKNQIINIIKEYLANKFECDIQDLNKRGLNVIKNNEENKIKMLLLYDLILVSSSNNFYEMLKKLLREKNVYEIFELPLVYGQSIYYIPDLKQISKQDEVSNFTFKFYDGNTNEINLTSGFENAITFENEKCISNIAYCAFDGDKIIGVAGADKINNNIWEVGIEVLPEYRKGGLATILTKNLTLRILKKGIVPIWCASSTNIGSQAVASKSGYIPLWFETFGDIFDNGFVYKELVKYDNISKVE